MSTRKQNKVIDPQTTSGGFYTLGGSPSGTDRLRISAGLSWHTSEDGAQMVHGEVPGSPPIVGVTFGTPTWEPPGRMFFGDTFGDFSQTIYVFGDPSVFETHEQWRNHLVENYQVGTLFTNYSTEYQSPFSPAESSVLGLESATATGQTTFDYNYYKQPYEGKIADPTVPHTILPHLYTFYLDKDRLTEAIVMSPSDAMDWRVELEEEIFEGDTEQDSAYAKFLTLNGALEETWVAGSVAMASPEGDRVGTFYYVDEAQGDYLSRWSNEYDRSLNRPSVDASIGTVSDLARKYQNIIVPRSTAALIPSYVRYSELFPMFAKIDFDLSEVSESERPFYKALRKGVGTSITGEGAQPGLIYNLLRATVNGNWQALGSGVTDRFMQDLSFDQEYQGVVYPEGQPILSPKVRSDSFPIFNLGHWIISTGDVSPPMTSAGWTDLEIRYNLEEIAEELEDDNEEGWFFLRNYHSLTNRDRYLTREEARFACRDIRYALKTAADNFGGYGEPVSEGGMTMTYEESLNGLMGYSEDMYFKVKKYAVINGVRNAEPAQTYILPNSNDVVTRMNLIDTQMKYGADYEYEIILGKLVIGTETRYTQADVFGGAGAYNQPQTTVTGLSTDEFQGRYYTVNSMVPFDEVDAVTGVVVARFSTQPRALNTLRIARIMTETRPSLRVIEVPYLSSKTNITTKTAFGVGSMLDTPPLPPDIGVTPYKGINNKLLFTFNTGMGSEQMMPPPARGAEAIYYEKLLSMARLVDPSQNTILYENDGPSTTFELMRLDKRPVSYADFNTGFRRIIGTEAKETGFKQVSSTAYIDTILPNVAYYYTFKATDIHGHLSYPTEIYEVILQDIDGAIFPKIRTVPLLSDEERKTKNKKLRRFLQIKPQISQVVLNLRDEYFSDFTGETAPFTNDLPMGIDATKVWGKRFKLRLTSRKTGKKIDLNINFNKEYNDTRPT